MRIAHTLPDGRYGSPNYVLTMLFNMLRRLQSGPNALPGGKEANTSDNEQVIQDAVASVFIGVNVVETFLNIYFKVFSEENKTAPCYAVILSNLSNRRFSLEQKMTKWPDLCFGCPLDILDLRYKEFECLKSLRNGLMHFKSSYTTITPAPGIQIDGLADLSLLNELNFGTPDSTAKTVSGFVELVLEARGLSPDQVSSHARLWLGLG